MDICTVYFIVCLLISLLLSIFLLIFILVCFLCILCVVFCLLPFGVPVIKDDNYFARRLAHCPSTTRPCTTAQSRLIIDRSGRLTRHLLVRPNSNRITMYYSLWTYVTVIYRGHTSQTSQIIPTHSSNLTVSVKKKSTIFIILHNVNIIFKVAN